MIILFKLQICIFDIDEPRLLEEALLGKELHQKLLPLTKKY